MTDKILIDRSVVEQALDALQDANTMMEHRQDVKLRHSAMADLRAALEQPQVEQEPVAWIEHEWSGSGLRHLHFERPAPTVRDEVVRPVWTPLYTHPQPQGGQEPVAYYVMNGAALFQLFRSKSQADALAYDLQKRHDLSGSLAHFHVVPLYTHPQPKREPLTEMEINTIWRNSTHRTTVEVVRAIEAAHGIGGEK